MAIRERLIYAIDVVTDGAKTGLAGFRKSVNEAEGATGKFKAGATSAFDTVKANAAGLALGAGTALVAFGVKSVQAFTEGALAAGKFSDASGLAVEDASRWQEVATDLGVSADAIAGGFVRLERAIASGSPAVETLGIDMVKAADGTADVNATMLVAIDRLGKIKDPAEKAQLASQLFGRGFADMAEIVLGDADDIRERLEGVSEAQIFDEGEVAKARDFRDAMDELTDAVGKIANSVGEALVPALTDAAEGINDLAAAAEDLKVDKIARWGQTAVKWSTNVSFWALKSADNVVGLGKSILGLGDDSDKAAPAIGHLVRSMQDGTMAAELLTRADEEAAAAVELVAEATVDLGDKQRNQIPEGRNYTAVQEALAAQHERVLEVSEALEAAADERAAAEREAAQAADEHRRAIDELVAAMDAQVAKSLELVGGDIAVRDAQRRAEDAAAELTATLELEETTLRDAGAAIDDTAAQYLNAAQTAADYTADQREANGETVNATERARLLKDELKRLAAETTGPLHDALMGLIDDINAIPNNKTVNIVLNRNVSGDAGGVAVRGARARGGPTYPGIHEVLEEGPELLQQDGKTFLLSNGGGNVVPLTGATGTTTAPPSPYIINVYPRTGDVAPEAIVAAIQTFERRNGKGWRAS